MKRLATIVAFLGLMACKKDPPPPAEPPAEGQTVGAVDDRPSDEKPPQELSPTEAGKLLVTLDATQRLHENRAPQTWLDLEQIANVHMTRARITGSVDEYLAAEKAIARSFELAPEGAGPFKTRARFHYTIHQNDKVEADVAKDEQRLLRKQGDKASTAALRGDLAFHRGDLDEARRLYDEALALEESTETVARLAFLNLKTGRIDEARKGYERAAELSRGDEFQRAWSLLHRGIVELEVGDPGAALKWYEQADAAFSGWYLIEEHIAEAKLLLGDADAAIAMYESIIARNPSGEFMGAMAECWAAKGDATKEAEWVKRAKEAFERDIAKLPSAASGHALEFYLAHDHPRALELAEANVKLRPNHEARIQAAQAYLANSSPEKAREILTPVTDTAWVTPDFFATVALAFRGVDEGRSSEASKRAASLDPGAEKGIAEMLKLSN